ncbi:MAG: UDP-N-acetylmuramate--L-alanine ligase [Bacteroidales bacterium]|nr:UDP-N-acetylmuramate--L-alanine ligase [Bacteroidales bacterium]
MMDFSKISHIWFIGIGGIGMSALARYFTAGDFTVGGYDRTESPLTKNLASEGMELVFTDDPCMVPLHYLDKEKSLIIYTPAIPDDNSILNYFRSEGYKMHKRSEILGVISRNTRSVAVAGTHGKTSVSTLTAHLLKQSETDCSAFLGGISKNYNTNLLTGTGNITVMEADEFDRSFLQLYPEMALITSLDADHLDVYGDHDSMVRAYQEFTGNVKDGGTIIINEKIAGRLRIPEKLKSYTYGFMDSSDYYPSDITVSEGAYHFHIHGPEGVIRDISLLLPGRMNIENAVGAVALAQLAGASDDDIRKALLYYKGVARRFDLRIDSDSIIYIDDYAHHPEELKYCVESVREFYGDRRITGIFQPHLYTRTRDHASAFAKALDKLDRAVLLPVYPAREEAIEGVDSGIIYERMNLKDKQLAMKEEVPDLLEGMDIEVLITMGAGDIDRLVGPIEALLKRRI